MVAKFFPEVQIQASLSGGVGRSAVSSMGQYISFVRYLATMMPADTGRCGDNGSEAADARHGEAQPTQELLIIV